MPKQEFNEWLVSRVRAYMKDYAHTNKLLQREEYKDEDIIDAILRVVSIFNLTPPPVYPVERVQDFPGGLETLQKGCASELMKSEAILRARNHLPYADGAMTINDDDKASVYMQIASQLGDEFRKEIQEFKRTYNVHRAMIGSRSPYATLFNHYLLYYQFRGI